MKQWIALVLTAVLLAGCTAPSKSKTTAHSEKPLVAASFYLMWDFAHKIGGERVEVVNLVPSGGDPHSWEPSVQDMAVLEEADLLVLNGADFEHWPHSVVPTLNNRELTVVDASQGIALLEGEQHGDHSHDSDPHVWLNPQNAKQQMAAIRDGLIAVDPEGAETYQQNYDTYATQCDALDQEYRDALSPLPNKEIVVAHQAFGYLCHRYGLTQLAVQGLSPEGEPDPAQMARIIAHAKERKIQVIFFEEQASPKVAEAVAREIGADTAVLSPLEGLSPQQEADGDDYFSVMRKNLQELKVALAE